MRTEIDYLKCQIDLANIESSDMCTNYRPTAREKLTQEFDPIRDRGPLPAWPKEVYRDSLAPIIVSDQDGGRRVMVANYGFVPKQHQKKRKKDTMNARGEEIHRKPTYAQEWQRCQLCLIPSQVVYEPFWEHRVHQRFAIGMADGSDFCAAGLWRENFSATCAHVTLIGYFSHCHS